MVGRTSSTPDPLRERVEAIIELTATIEAGNQTSLRLTNSVEELTKRVEAKDRTYHRILAELRAIVAVIFLLLFVNLFAVARLQSVAKSNQKINQSNSKLLKDIEDATGPQAQARSQDAIAQIERDLDQRFRDALNESTANGTVGPAPSFPTTTTTTTAPTTTTTTTIIRGQSMPRPTTTTAAPPTTTTSPPTTAPPTTTSTTTRPTTTTTTTCVVVVNGRCVP